MDTAGRRKQNGNTRKSRTTENTYAIFGCRCLVQRQFGEPHATRGPEATNRWDLYDMEGNVWEGAGLGSIVITTRTVPRLIRPVAPGSAASCAAVPVQSFPPSTRVSVRYVVVPTVWDAVLGFPLCREANRPQPKRSALFPVALRCC